MPLSDTQEHLSHAIRTSKMIDVNTVGFIDALSVCSAPEISLANDQKAQGDLLPRDCPKYPA